MATEVSYHIILCIRSTVSAVSDFTAPGEVRKVPSRFRAQRIPAPNPQLFEDTSMQQPSYGYPASS